MGVITDTPLFDKVREATNDALLIAWDGCHKIYLAMDDVQAAWFAENYAPVDEDDSSRVFTGTPDEMLVTIGEWWERSCFLRFVSAVRDFPTDPNSGFTDLISQFAEEDDEDEDEMNEGCGKWGCKDCYPDEED